MKYPIICAAMVELSDCNLAMAVRDSGCLPSFTIFDVKEAYKFGSNQFNLFVDFDSLSELRVHQILDLKPLIVEYVFTNYDNRKNTLQTQLIQDFIKVAKQRGIQFMVRTTVPSTFTAVENVFDIIHIKGSESAGCPGSASTRDNFNEQQKLTPNVKVYPSGGIYSGKDIEFFLSRNAEAVIIGTPFALTKESKMHDKVKQKLLQPVDVQLIPSADGLDRNGIILDTEHYHKSTNHLKLGVHGIGGHVYAGRNVNQITEIKSVNELVTELMLDVTVSTAWRS